MAWLRLCRGDELIDTLRDVFGANIMRIPESRMRPLVALMDDGRKVAFLGALKFLITDPPQFPSPATSQMPKLKGKKSRSVDTEMGLKVLDGYLSGMGVGGGDLSGAFKGVSKVSYTFGDVKRQFVDIGEVGALLQGKSLNLAHPTVPKFRDEEHAALLVVDSVITSSAFTLTADETASNGFKFDVAKIQGALGVDGGVKVETSTGMELNFSGKRPLAFAFSCVRLAVTKSGKIITFQPDDVKREMGLMSATTKKKDYSAAVVPNRTLLSAKPVMVEISTLE